MQYCSQRCLNNKDLFTLLCFFASISVIVVSRQDLEAPQLIPGPHIVTIASKEMHRKINSFSKCLTLLLFLENLVGVVRNFHFAEHRYRKLAYAILFLAASLCINNLMKTTYFNNIEFTETNSRIHLCATVLNSFSVGICSMATAKKYETLVSHLGHAHSYFENVTAYNTHAQSHYKYVIFNLVVLRIVSVSMILLSVGEMLDLYQEFFIWCIFSNVIVLACSVRSDLQYLHLYTILHILSEQMDFLSLDLTRNRCDFLADEPNNIKLIISRIASCWKPEEIEYFKLLDSCCNTYIHISESSGHLKTIFAFPISLTITLTVMYHIVISYVLTTQSVYEGLDDGQVRTFILMVLPNLWCLFLMCRAGQRLHDSAQKVNRAIARSLITNDSDVARYKAVRRLSHVVASRPISFILFGRQHFGYALLPAILASFSSNLIIALQFNNIV